MSFSALISIVAFLSKSELRKCLKITKNCYHEWGKSDDIYATEKTAFNANWGQFEYLFIPMRQCNTSATYQSLMNWVFYDYIDVFLCILGWSLDFSEDEESHVKHKMLFFHLWKNTSYVYDLRNAISWKIRSNFSYDCWKIWYTGWSEKGWNSTKLAETKELNRSAKFHETIKVLPLYYQRF